MKIMELCNSFSVVNFIMGFCLLDSVKVSFRYVFLWSTMPSAYLKYPVI
jgi:hypothetical protein